MKKDSYDVITGEGLTVCPECGDYSDQEYTFIDDEEDTISEDVSICSLCGRYFT